MTFISTSSETKPATQNGGKSWNTDGVILVACGGGGCSRSESQITSGTAKSNNIHGCGSNGIVIPRYVSQWANDNGGRRRRILWWTNSYW